MTVHGEVGPWPSGAFGPAPHRCLWAGVDGESECGNAASCVRYDATAGGWLPCCAACAKLPTDSCCQCGATWNEDGTPVTWRCGMCQRRVCRGCALVHGSPPGPAREAKTRSAEYLWETLCSRLCWELDGRSNE